MNRNLVKEISNVKRRNDIFSGNHLHEVSVPTEWDRKVLAQHGIRTGIATDVNGNPVVTGRAVNKTLDAIGDRL